MSNLYVRVKTNFFTNLKTVHLHTAIGDAAYWIPVKLWTHAAENVPSGDLSKYSDSDLATVLGCDQSVPNVKSLLTDAGFIDKDTGRLHEWEEHNEYHATFQKRAKKAAAARWGLKSKSKDKEKEKRETRPKEQSNAIASVKQCLSNATSITANIGGGVLASIGDSAAFNGSWGRWLKHSSELKYPPTESALVAQWNKCCESGANWAQTCISYSIEKDSKSIIEDPTYY